MTEPKRLSLFEFTEFATFNSSEWHGREVEWFGIAVNLLHIYSYVNFPPPPRLLDLAPGEGRYSIELARRGDVEVHVAVTEQRDLERLNRLSTEFSGMLKPLLIGERLNLNTVDDASFDIVLALGPFWEVAQPDMWQECARGIARILVPDGVVFVTYSPQASRIVERLLRSSQSESVSAICDSLLDEDQAFKAPSSLSQLDEIFVAAGLQREDVYGSTAITKWLAPDLWARIRHQGEDEFESLFDLVTSIASDSHAASMSTESMAVYVKP